MGKGHLISDSSTHKRFGASHPIVRAETAAALQAEIKLVQAMSQAELQRAQAVAQLQISTLEASVKESNAKFQEVQNQLQTQSLRMETISPEKEEEDNKTQERLKEMDEKLQSIQVEMSQLNKENSRLVKELTSAHSEVPQLPEMRSQSTSPQKQQGAEDLLTKNAKWKNRRSASVTRRMGKERRKWNHNILSAPEMSESEGTRTLYKNLAGNQSSAQERKGEQRWQNNLPRTAHSPDRIERPWSSIGRPQNSSYLGKHRKYKSHEDGEPSHEIHIPSASHTPTSELVSQTSPSGRLTPQLEVVPYLEAGVHTPQVEARYKDVGEKVFVLAKAEIERDLVRTGGNRLSNEDGGKVASKIANFETKFGAKKTRREEILEQKVDRARETKKEKQEKKEKMSVEEAMEEEARRKAEIVDAATMDVGEDQPSIPSSEKEKWLEEHPYKPIPQRPHVLSKYPHPPNVFSSTRDELVHQLDAQLGGELKKFGFGRDTEGISDSVYDAAKTALEKQHKNRVSNLQLNQKKILEYERGAILWQTQRAVHERDIQIIDSHFEVESDDVSQQSLSARSHSPSREDTDNLSMQDKRGGWCGRRDDRPIVKSPQSSMSPTLKSPLSPLSPHLKVHEQVKRETGHVVETLETLESISAHKHNWERDMKKHVSPSIVNRHSPPQTLATRATGSRHSPTPYDTHLGKDEDNGKHVTKYLFPTIAKFKRAEANMKLKDEEENQAEAYGLGQWESDEDVPHSTALRDTAKYHGKESRTSPKSSKDVPGFNSDGGSDESKIFQELDAEIDEIIRL